MFSRQGPSGLMSSSCLTIPAGLPEAPVHSIPCKTTFSGPAKVRTYFQPAVDVEQQRVLAAHSNATALGVPQISAFRGRTLRGAEVALPEGFSGVSVYVLLVAHARKARDAVPFRQDGSLLNRFRGPPERSLLSIRPSIDGRRAARLFRAGKWIRYFSR